MVLLGVIEIEKITRIPQRLIPFEMSSVSRFQFDVVNEKIIIQDAGTACPFCGRIGLKELGVYNVCLMCAEHMKEDLEGEYA